MTRDVIECDVCHKIKGEGNKWLKAAIDDSLTNARFIIVSSVSSESFGSAIVVDFCSDACLFKFIQPIIDKQREEK